MSDDELGEDEEEILIYVELEGVVGSSTFTTEQLQLDMIGIDSEHPIMQINGRFYEGTFEDAIGTYMFFAKNENAISNDPVFEVAPTVKYAAKTRKLLKMQRIFIKHRTEVLGDSEDIRCIPNLETITEAGVPLKQQEEALSFWKTVRNSRMNALNSYLEKQRIREEKKSMGIIVDSESDEDNPFAAYKQHTKYSSIDQQPNIVPNIVPNTKSNYESKTEKEVRSQETGEVGSEKAKEVGADIMREVEAKLTQVPETLQNQSLDSSAPKEKQQKPKCSKKEKQKSKKKTIVIHDPRRKQCKQVVKSKFAAKRKVAMQEKQESITEVVADIESSIQQKVVEVPEICSEPRELKTEAVTSQEEISTNQEVKELDTELKETKRLKREIKMKEIVERLKAFTVERETD